MNGLAKEIKDSFKFGSSLTRLLLINVAVFVFFRIIYVILALSGRPDLFQVVHWLSVPAYLPSLMVKPWTIITYMFYHEDPIHIAFNLAALFWFGKIFLIYFDNKKFTSVYLLGGISGALLYILFYNIFHVFEVVLPVSVALGASASIMALIVAVSFYAPNFKVYLLFLGEVKLLYLGVGYIVLDVIMLYSSNSGGHIAHLGGALFGYIWVKNLQKGKDFTIGFSNITDKIASLFRRRKLKVTYSKPPSNEYDYNKMKVVNQKEIDRILDKISKGGYDKLSKDEKDTLFRLGNK